MKRLVIAVVLVLATFFVTTPTFADKKQPERICLNPGSYIVTKRGPEIFVMPTNSNGLITESKTIQISIPGTSPDERVAANSCDVFFAWAKPGQKSDIWAINVATGWELRRITNTPDVDEEDPVLNGWNTRVAFTEQAEVPNVGSVPLKKDKQGHKTERVNAQTPAWQERGPLTYTLPDGRIYIWGASGQWHTYRPDRSGILVQDGQKFIFWPVIGIPFKFGEGRSVAYRPTGSLAAVITLDGNLQIVTLNERGEPYGPALNGSGLTDLEFVIWIDAP